MSTAASPRFRASAKHKSPLGQALIGQQPANHGGQVRFERGSPFMLAEDGVVVAQ